MKKLQIAIIVFFTLFLTILGVFSQYPAAITPDSAMHAEIVEIIYEQLYIVSWEPYADNVYTYPPLFHYLAALLPLQSIDAVRVFGIILWLLLPVTMYFLASTFDKKAAFSCAIISSLVPSLATIFIYGEFPQLMSMILLMWMWFFLRKKEYLIAGIILGLIALTHIFFILIAALLFAYYMIKDKKAVFGGIIAFVVSIPWLPAYITVIKTVLNGTWENTRYNVTQPVFSFWPFDVIFDWLFGMQSLTPILLILAVFGFLKVKDKVLRTLFLLSLFFTMYHIPFTQLKIYDLLAIPVVLLAIIGIYKTNFSPYTKKIGVVILTLFLIFAQVNHFIKVDKWWLNPEIAPTDSLIDAAQSLKDYDPNKVKIYSHQASAWVGILSNKYPLNPDITHLEAFSDEYKKQLGLRDEIKNRLVKGDSVRQMLKENDVAYIIVPIGIKTQLPTIYQNSEWTVYQVV